MRTCAGVILMCLCAGVSGCATSRWAMDHPAYAEKYGIPYEEDEKLPRMAKQLIDARHLSGESGIYVAAMGADEPVNVGGELGIFIHPPFETPWLETRLALAGLIGGDVGVAGGFDMGMRAQSPSRIAPFVGFGLFASIDDGEELTGTEDADAEFLGAIYPEFGAHLWSNSRWRLSGFGRYYVTTHGRDHDFWGVGLSLSCLTH